jgi:hypothetical protein
VFTDAKETLRMPAVALGIGDTKYKCNGLKVIDDHWRILLL